MHIPVTREEVEQALLTLYLTVLPAFTARELQAMSGAALRCASSRLAGELYGALCAERLGDTPQGRAEARALEREEA